MSFAVDGGLLIGNEISISPSMGGRQSPQKKPLLQGLFLAYHLVVWVVLLWIEECGWVINRFWRDGRVSISENLHDIILHER